jgi:hypothetical protein
MTRAALAAGILVALAAACASPDPFTDAQAAYARGDVDAAYESLRLSAESGNAKAALALGTMLETGVDVLSGQKIAMRPEEAARWYRQAAGAGEKEAGKRLGMMYTYGRGVPVDYAEAVRLLGPPTAEMQHGVRKYPPAEQAEIEAWMLALSLEMRRHSAALKRDFSKGANVSIVVRARDSTVLVESSSSASDRVRQAAIEAAKGALVAAPATPAAAQAHATAHFDFAFR